MVLTVRSRLVGSGCRQTRAKQAPGELGMGLQTITTQSTVWTIEQKVLELPRQVSPREYGLLRLDVSPRQKENVSTSRWSALDDGKIATVLYQITSYRFGRSISTNPLMDSLIDSSV